MSRASTLAIAAAMAEGFEEERPVIIPKPLPEREPVAFKPLEIAYRIPGKRWARRIIKTQGALSRLLVRIEHAEVRFRNLEES